MVHYIYTGFNKTVFRSNIAQSVSLSLDLHQMEHSFEIGKADYMRAAEDPVCSVIW